MDVIRTLVTNLVTKIYCTSQRSKVSRKSGKLFYYLTRGSWIRYGYHLLIDTSDPLPFGPLTVNLTMPAGTEL